VVKWQTRTFEGRMPKGVGVQVPPRAEEMSISKWLSLNNLLSNMFGKIQNLNRHRLISRLKSKSTPGEALRTRPYSYRRLDPNDGCRWRTTRPSDEGQVRISFDGFRSAGRVPSISCQGMDSPQIPHCGAELPRCLPLRRAGPMEAIPVGVPPGQLARSLVNPVPVSRLLLRSPLEQV
jgi:hypothetical protein